MKLSDAYYEFSLLVNKNAERKDINIDKANYYVLYNREALRWVSEFIERNNSSDNILSVSELLLNNVRLDVIGRLPDRIEYAIPSNFFKIVIGNAYSDVTSTVCGTSGVVYIYFKKPGSLNIQKEDKFTAPSFGWERTLADIYKDKIVVYKSDFNINDSYISYYKKPKEIDLVSPDEDMDLELSSYLVGQINDRVVSEIYREFNNPGIQIANSRQQITI